MAEDKPEYCRPDCVAIPDGIDKNGKLCLSIDLRPVRLQSQTGGVGFSNWPSSVSNAEFIVEASKDGTSWASVAVEDDKAFRDPSLKKAADWMWWHMFTEGLLPRGAEDAKGAFELALDLWSWVEKEIGPTILIDGEAPREEIVGYSYSGIAKRVHGQVDDQASRSLITAAARANSNIKALLLKGRDPDITRSLRAAVEAPFDPVPQIAAWKTIGALFPDQESLRRTRALESEKAIVDTVRDGTSELLRQGGETLGGLFSTPLGAFETRLERLYGAPSRIQQDEQNRSSSQMEDLYRHFRTDGADANADEEDAEPETLKDQVRRRLAALQAHPTLRKLFHLIADVKISPSALGEVLGGAAGFGYLRVRVKRDGIPDMVPESESVFRLDANARLFEPASEFEFNGSANEADIRVPLQNGVVALTKGGRFGLETIDATSAAKSFSTQAVSTREAHASGEALLSVPTERPVPRTRGIMLLDTDATEAAKRAQTREGRTKTPRRLFAEDLLNGFRAIVLNPSGDIFEPNARKLVYPAVHSLLGQAMPSKPSMKIGHIYPDYAHRDFGVVTPTSRVIEEMDEAGKPVTRLSESQVMLTWTGDPLSIPSLRGAGKDANIVVADKSDLPFEMWIGPAPDKAFPPLRRGAGYRFMLLACKPNGSSIPIDLAQRLSGNHALGDASQGNAPFVFRVSERAPAPALLVTDRDPLIGSLPASTPNETADTIVLRSGPSSPRPVTRVLLAGGIARDSARQARQFDDDRTFEQQLLGVYRYVQQTKQGGFMPIVRRNTPAGDPASAGYVFKQGPSSNPSPIYVDPIGRNLGFGFRRGAVRPVGYTETPPKISFWQKGEVPSNATVRPVFLTIQAKTSDFSGNYKLIKRTERLGGQDVLVNELIVAIAPAEEVTLDIWSFGDFAQGAQTLRYAEGPIISALEALQASAVLRATMRLGDLDFEDRDAGAIAASITRGEPSTREATRIMSAFEEVSANLLSRERLPGLSEMTTLTLVHAVQRPLARPQFLPGADGLRFVRILEKDNRSWGAHIGAIDPRAVRDSRNIPDQAEGSAAYAVGAFNIHRASTGQATMDGGWYDHGAPEALRQVRGEWQHKPVFRSLSLDVPEIPRRDDGPDASRIDMLRDDSGALRGTKVRIDTGDAAPDMIARRVAVQLTATSRFVPYFPETRPRHDFALSSVANGGGQDAVKAALQQPKPQSTSAIASFWMPATRRPERPQISEETLIRQFILDPDDGGKTLRASFRVIRRLYLGKKWFTSGEGELLVMLLLPGDQFGICSATNSAKSKVSQTNDSIESLIEQQRAEPWMKPYITQWGGDVTMKSSPLDTDLPQANFIKGWSIQCGGLALPSPDGPSPAPKPEYKGRNVSILGFTPKLDAQRGEWYCDMEVDASLAYTAMVRLGLAAYQPNAIVGQELSLPVGLEPYPLQPRWDVMVQRSVNVMEIQVTGAGYKERAPSVLGLTGGDTAEIAQQVLERTQTPNLQFRLCHADTGIQVVENGEPVIDVKLTPNSSSGGRPMWIGKLPIPTSEQGRPLRVHVSEVITHANAEAAIEGSGANPLVTLPTSFAFDTTMPAI